MPRLTAIDPAHAEGKTKALLDGVQKTLGMIPNLMAVMAEAPALLKSYFTIGNIFAETSLSPAERQVVLLAASYVNECTYCMAAYSTLAESQGLSPFTKVPVPIRVSPATR